MATTLKKILNENKASCFVRAAAAGEKKPLSKEDDIFFIGKIEKEDCMQARCFNIENFRALYGCMSRHSSIITNYSVSDDILSKNRAQINLNNIKYDDVVIPVGYECLMEVLTDKCRFQNDGLDHETDVISLAGRLTQPVYYLLAKPLKLFELQFDSKYKAASGSNYEDNYAYLTRKWTEFEEGTICIANKVSMVVFAREKSQKNFLLQKLQNKFPCLRKRNKVKFEVAIEFKILKNFKDLNNFQAKDRKNSLHIFNVDLKDIERARNTCKMEEKSYFLPIYNDPNDFIDLIPISPRNAMQLNSLHSAFSLTESKRFAYPINVKIKTEHQNSLNSSTSSKSSKKNPYADNIYEIYDKRKLELIFGVALKTKRMQIFSADLVNKFEVINEKDLCDVFGCDDVNKYKIFLPKKVDEFYAGFKNNLHEIYANKPTEPEKILEKNEKLFVDLINQVKDSYLSDEPEILTDVSRRNTKTDLLGFVRKKKYNTNPKNANLKKSRRRPSVSEKHGAFSKKKGSFAAKRHRSRSLPESMHKSSANKTFLQNIASILTPSQDRQTKL
jgi:hypothetical protein